MTRQVIFDDKGIFGFDVSFYQATYNLITRTWTYIDFQKMKDYGASFVIIKCGQDDYLDATFKHNWREAKRIGIPRASYWFLDQDNQAQEQARIYWNAIKDDPGEGPLVVDYEFGSGGMWFVLYDFIAELQRLSGYSNERIWIYTGYFYWLEHRPQSLAQRAFFSKYPLWLAYYTDKPAYAQCPSDWEEPVLWQEGTPAIGLAAGAQSKEIDRNRFNGNDLAKHFGGVQPTPPLTGADMKGVVKAGFTLKIRNAAGEDTGLKLYNGDTVYGEVRENRIYYGKVYPSTAPIYVPAFGECNSAVRDATAEWMTLTNEPEPVTPPSTTITIKHTIDVYTDGSVKLDGAFIP